MQGDIPILSAECFPFKSRGDKQAKRELSKIISYVGEYYETNKKEKCKSTEHDQDGVGVARVS